jgi:steroid 5-alpha reductase family enzyme
MIRRPWLTSAIIWAAGMVLVGLIVALPSHGGGKRVDWAEVIALALIIPSIGSVGLAWGLHQRGQQPVRDQRHRRV